MPPTTYQGQQAKALPSTVLYVDGTLTTDLSQYDTDLTASGSQVYEDPSARTAIFDERSITIECLMTSTDSGTLVYQGSNAVAPLYHVTVSAGVVTIEDDNELSMSVTVPGLGVGDSTVYLLFSTKADPIGGTYYTEGTAYNATTDDDPVTVRSTHGADTPDAADHFSIGGRWTGAAMADTYGNTVQEVRIDNAYLAPHMLREFITESSPAAYGAREEVARLPDRRGTTEIEHQGEFAGPAIDLGAFAHKGHGLRMLGQLTNRVFRSPQACDPNDYDNTYDESWHREYGAGARTAIPFLDESLLPPIGNRIQVRVHAKMYNSVTTASDLEVRCYSANRKPGLGGFQNEDAPPLEQYHVSETVSDHGVSGDGEVIEFTDLLKIARTPSGTTWLFLVFIVGGGAPHVADRFEISSWCCELLSKEVADGGIIEVGG